jgi:uncharacterized DUF497 family protein
MFDDFEFDDAKDAANMAKHGLSFRDFSGFDAPASIIGMADRTVVKSGCAPLGASTAKGI